MFPLRLAVASLAVAAFFANRAAAKPLEVGDPAPPVSVGKWVKGEPLDTIKEGKVHIVTFWATWCPESVEQFERLSGISNAYPDAVVIAASIWEPDAKQVEPFIAQRNLKATFRIATDDTSKDKNGAMASAWMDAAGHDKLPMTFVIDQEGVVAFIGDLNDADDVLDRVLGKAAAPEPVDEAAAQRRVDEYNKLIADYARSVNPLWLIGDNTAAAKAIDALVAKYPDFRGTLLYEKFERLMQAENYDLAYAAADECAAQAGVTDDQLNQIAWYIVDNQGVDRRDLDRAMRYATRAVELSHGRNGAILDTLARVYFERGDVDKAIEFQTRALDVANPAEFDVLMEAMDRYRAALPK